MKRRFKINKRQERDRLCPNGRVDRDRKREREIERAEGKLEVEKI